MTRPVDPADIARFLELAGGGAPLPDAPYRGRPLDFFRAVVAALADRPPDDTRDRQICDRIIVLLLSGKRFFDIASLHAAVKKRHGDPAGGRELHTAFRAVLLDHIRELFNATLTYHSPELDALFCETLGDDRQRFLELLGLLFEERRLYTMRLSPNLQRMFYTIADENLRHFVQFSNIHFLAFYLGALRTLTHATPAHIEKWISLTLSPTTSREIIDKLLDAVKLNPSVDFLLLFLLLPRDPQRATVLTLLRATLERRPHLLRESRDALVYFLGRILASDFYDFHRIPQDQKQSISNLLLFAEDETLFRRLLDLIGEPNPHADAKQAETKKIFVQLIGKWGEKDPTRLSALRQLLRGETLEESVKQEIIRVLRGLPQQEEKTMVSPTKSAPVETGRTQDSPLQQGTPVLPSDDADPDEKTLISPMFGGSPVPPGEPPPFALSREKGRDEGIPDDDPEETTVVDRKPQ